MLIEQFIFTLINRHVEKSSRLLSSDFDRMSAKVCLKSNRNLLKMKDKHPVIHAIFLIPRQGFF